METLLFSLYSCDVANNVLNVDLNVYSDDIYFTAFFFFISSQIYMSHEHILRFTAGRVSKLLHMQQLLITCNCCYFKIMLFFEMLF